MMNDAYGHIDKGQSTLFIALNLSATFDMVKHFTLLTQLKDSFGVTGTAREWISFYLPGVHSLFASHRNQV